MEAECVMQLMRLIPPDDSVLEWALRKNMPWGVLKDLIKHHRCDPAAKRASAFMTACRLGNNGAVRLFLAAHQLVPSLTPIDPGMDDNCALRLARKCEHDDVILTLISRSSVDARIDDHELLVYAVSKDSVILVRALVQWKRAVPHETSMQFVNPYANDALAVHTALARNHAEILRLVLIDWQPPYGAIYTPRTSLQQAILRAATNSAYVHDYLDTKWRQSPRIETPVAPQRVLGTTAYYTSDDDEEEDEIVDISGVDDNPLGKSVSRASATPLEQ